MPSVSDVPAHDIIEFWFSEIDSSLHFKKDLDFDRLIIKRFGKTHSKAEACELWRWRETPQGRLAEIIILDQFSRNMFRDGARAFAHDAQALTLAQEAIARGEDSRIAKPEERVFFYMPYMHSESADIHNEAVRLFTALGLEEPLAFEYAHKKIIDRFGRYPHRNEILGRVSTAEEVTFLREPDSSF